MFFKNFQKTFCINGCALFNDNSNFEYWENKKVTSDEIEIVKFINNKINNKKISILHIGIGNSYLASNITLFDKIDGITISGNEKNFGDKLKINNYNIFFLNKLEKDIFIKKKIKNYDLIIDVNIKSFCCCNKAFQKLFNDYSYMLNENGLLITGKQGMNWSRLIKPVYSFSLKKFFYRRLKEYDGPKSNILTIEQSDKISRENNLTINYNTDQILIFKKNG